MEWSKAILTVSSAVVAGVVGLLVGRLNARREANTKIKLSAFACYRRLCKIMAAEDPKVKEHEIYYLGGDLDKYRDAVGARPPGYKAHEEALFLADAILLNHDLSRIKEVAETFRRCCDPKRLR
jgi:hypothetical protein